MKKIFILCIIFLLTGCSIETEIFVKPNETMNEKIKIKFSNNFTINYDNATQYAESYLDYYKKSLDLNNYEYEIKESKNATEVDLIKKSNNFCDGVNNNLFSRYLYTTIKCTENDSFYMIKSVGSQKISLPQNQKEFNIENLKLKITLPIKAEENNADEIDGNTYIWKYDENTKDKNFYIKISKTALENNRKLLEEQEKSKALKNKIITISTVIIILLALGIVSLIFYKKYKRNKIDYK